MDQDIPGLKITMTDVIAAGHCVAGAKAWATKYNLEWRDFLRGGIPAEDMMATGDAQGIQVVERTIARRNQQNPNEA